VTADGHAAAVLASRLQVLPAVAAKQRPPAVLARRFPAAVDAEGGSAAVPAQRLDSAVAADSDIRALAGRASCSASVVDAGGGCLMLREAMAVHEKGGCGTPRSLVIANRSILFFSTL
jgi:hypothetical protein